MLRSKISVSSDESFQSFNSDSTFDYSNSVTVTANNIICKFHVGCQLNLRHIALTGLNTEYYREKNVLIMRLRKYNTSAEMRKSGEITCLGATHELTARTACRKYTSNLRRLGFKTAKFSKFRVVKVFRTCIVPFTINVAGFFQNQKEKSSYEPELWPGVIFTMKELKTVLKILPSGTVTIIAPSEFNAHEAVKFVYPILCQFKKTKCQKEAEPLEFTEVLNFEP